MRREVTVSQRIVPADKGPGSDLAAQKDRTKTFCPKKPKRHPAMCQLKAAPAATLEGGRNKWQAKELIKLKAYDHNLIDQSAQRIVDTAKRTGAKISGPVPLPTKQRDHNDPAGDAQIQKDSREQFEIKTQTLDRHPRSKRKDDGRADASRPSCGRGHRN